MIAVFPFLLLALALGLKHSYDADHLIAVSNILRKAESLKSSAKIGLSWAIGHMLTATIITVLLYSFKETMLSIVLPHFEKIVGVMIIVLGILSLKDIFAFHSHRHSHGIIVHSHPHTHLKHREEKHFHRHMLGIGIMHGLASNDDLLMLFTSSLAITTLGGLLLGLGVFSLGVVLGMALFALIFSYPLVKLRSGKIYRIVSLLAGVISITYGALMIFTFM